jgi:hypothetical protein
MYEIKRSFASSGEPHDFTYDQSQRPRLRVAFFATPQAAASSKVRESARQLAEEWLKEGLSQRPILSLRRSTPSIRSRTP